MTRRYCQHHYDQWVVDDAQRQHPSWPYCHCDTPHPVAVFFGLATQCGTCLKPIEGAAP